MAKRQGQPGERWHGRLAHASGGRLARRVPAITGFTLVELLVVIAMIAILATMLLPALGRMRQQAKANATLNDIHLLDRACELFKDEDESNRGKKDSDKVYPSSYGGAPETRGAFSLYNALLRKWDTTTARYVADPKKAALYEADRIKTIQMLNFNTGNPLDAFVFADAFGSPILYYVFDPTVTAGRVVGYRPADNVRDATIPTRDILNPPPDPQDTTTNWLLPNNGDRVNWYAAREGNMPSNTITGFFRKDFILISPGPNKRWDYPRWPRPNGGKSDDLTNFWPVE